MNSSGSPTRQSLPRLFLLTLLALLTQAHVLLGNGIPRPPSVEVFDFDYTWTPNRPVASDTVVFQAKARLTDLSRWNLTDDSFRWYQQLPSSGFHLRHVGRSYTRNASETYFEGRYRLRVLVEQLRQLPRPDVEAEQAWDNSLLVDVVKYVGVQKRIDIALLVNATGGNGSSSSGSSSDRILVCRFWGSPLVDSLQFLPAVGSVCDRQHFESAEAEPHIDLVVRCPRLLPGSYSCYGRNAVSASQLSCELTGPQLTDVSCFRPALDGGAGRVGDVEESSGAVRSPETKSRQSAGPLGSGQVRTRASTVVAMATIGMAAVVGAIVRADI